MTNTSSISSALVKLHKLIMTDKKDVSSVYFFAIVGGLISLSLPLGIQTIINFVIANTLSTSIIVLIAIVIAGVFLNGFVQVRQSQVIERIRQKIFTRYTLEFSHKIPKISLEEMDNYYLPEVVNRFFDITALAKSIEKLLIDIPTSLIQILLGLILLSFYHPLFIGFGAFVLIVLVIIIRITSPKGFRTNMQSSDYKYKTAGWLQEIARGAKTFRYSKGSSLHMLKTDELVSEFLGSRTKHFKILTVQYWSLIVFKILIVATMLIAGTWLLLNQQINVGQFIAVDIVIILIISSVEKLISTMDNVYDSLTSIEKLGKIVDSKIESNGNLNFDNTNGCYIDFVDVKFAYPNGSKALHHANFMIASNKVTCIKGASGAGRSTILRLLTGAYPSFEGSILLNKIPIGNYNLYDLRKHTGIMLNEQDIFRGTILENLTMGSFNIGMKEITYLADKIGFTEFITTNKNGYDTLLDPMGKRLSNHVKQNIKLLRALLGKPTLLLLEEPLAHLNATQEFAIMEYLRLESNATVMIISNDKKLHTLCDQVLALEDGVIIN
jgi:ATP-binding cassette, subfamily B, bacterial